MGKFQGHSYLGGNFSAIIQQKLIKFSMTSGWERVPEEVAARVKGVMAFHTGEVRKEGESWYEPDGSFGVHGPPPKTMMVVEVS